MHIRFDAFFYVKITKANTTYDLNTLLATGAENLIPIELAIKIARKIKAKERFAAYIVIPMWPEGNPTTAAMQEILYWQVDSSSWLHFSLKIFDALFFSLMFFFIASILSLQGAYHVHDVQDRRRCSTKGGST